MEVTQLIPHVEALIFASDRALSTLELTDLINQAFGFMEDKIPMDQVEAAVEGITEKYAAEFYPFEVRQSGGGWQFLTKKEYHKTIAQLNGDKFLKRLSVAALETLAIIAYRQPITRADLEAVRGVAVDGVMQTILDRGLIRIAGRSDIPGRPLLYETTQHFMEHFGLKTLDDLPNAAELRKIPLPKAEVPEPAKATKPASEDTTPTAEPAADLSLSESAPAENISDPTEDRHEVEAPVFEETAVPVENSEPEPQS